MPMSGAEARRQCASFRRFTADVRDGRSPLYGACAAQSHPLAVRAVCRLLLPGDAAIADQKIEPASVVADHFRDHDTLADAHRSVSPAAKRMPHGLSPANHIRLDKFAPKEDPFCCHWIHCSGDPLLEEPFWVLCAPKHLVRLRVRIDMKLVFRKTPTSDTCSFTNESEPTRSRFGVLQSGPGERRQVAHVAATLTRIEKMLRQNESHLAALARG